MFFKLFSTILLSLAAPSADAAERSLQASLACFALNGTVASCCPDGANAYDGVCTLVSCLEFQSGLSIRDGCSCYDIAKACDQVVALATLVASLPDMCDSVGECCADDGTTTTNVDWDFCMAEAAEAESFTMPDFSTLIPSGLSDLGIPGFPTGSTTATTVPTAAPTAPVPVSASGRSSKFAADAALALSFAFLIHTLLV
jgi:hypothetical protein